MMWKYKSTMFIMLPLLHCALTSANLNFGGPFIRRLGDNVVIVRHGGKVRGVMVEFPNNTLQLQNVERFTGVQFGSLRGVQGSSLVFMPPSSAFLPLRGDKVLEFTKFAPVCFQNAPAYRATLEVGFKARFDRINEYLHLQNMECLHHNIWVPGKGMSLHKKSIMPAIMRIVTY